MVVNSNRWAVVTQDAASLVDAVRDGVRDGVWESVAVRVTVADSVAVLVGDEVLVSDRRRVGPQPLIGLKVILINTIFLEMFFLLRWLGFLCVCD